MERCDCWRSYEAQDGFISFARGSTRWLSSAGRGCVVSYAMAIASVRETDRGSIGGSLEKLCDDGLMKSGSDMSQSHWLRVVEYQGRNRAGAGQERVEGFEMRVYVSAQTAGAAARPWPDRQAFGLYGSTSTFVLREWPPPSPPSKGKMGQEVVGIAHCCFRRLRGYSGTLDEGSHRQAQLSTHVATARSRPSSGWSGKMKSRDGLNTARLTD